MNGPSIGELADRIAQAEPRLGRTRLVLIDGPSSAGKTTLALALAGSIPAEVVQTDALLEGWTDQFTYWERLERLVLGPIAVGIPGGYHAYDWYQSRVLKEWTTVPAADVLIVEGVGVARAEARAMASLSIFVDAPRDVRAARSLARDGTEMQEPLRLWRKKEELHFGGQATRWCVDLVVRCDDHPGLGSGS